ncbi:MAG TPA: AraC family transcriptional regulator [Armatimonadota bacterium]|jgi:AraC-like DNA-binding protein
MQCSPYLRLVHDYTPTSCGQLTRGRYQNDHALHYFKAGHGRYHCAEGDFDIRPGLLALHRPGAAWSFQMAADSALHMYNIIFDVIERADSYHPFPYPPQFPRPHLESFEALDNGGERLPEVQLLLAPSEYENLFSELHALLHQETVQATLRRKALFLEILALVYRNAAEQRGDAAMTHARLVAEAVALLRDQVVTASPITLREIAGRLAVSRALFCRIFQQRMGVPPMKYLMGLKIERAQVELILHLRSIKETAELLGFSSVHHFTRVFHQYTGDPPGQFLRRYAARP